MTADSQYTEDLYPSDERHLYHEIHDRKADNDPGTYTMLDKYHADRQEMIALDRDRRIKPNEVWFRSHAIMDMLHRAALLKASIPKLEQEWLFRRASLVDKWQKSKSLNEVQRRMVEKEGIAEYERYLGKRLSAQSDMQRLLDLAEAYTERLRNIQSYGLTPVELGDTADAH